jgi:hypothetical protein
MRDMGDYWQVAEVKDIDGYMRQLDLLETARTDSLNRPVRDAISKHLALVNIQKSEWYNDYWGYSGVVLVRMKFKNLGSEQIDTFYGGTILRSGTWSVDDTAFFYSTTPLSPGDSTTEAWHFDVNMFSDEKKALFNLPLSSLDATTVIYRVSLSDGTTLKLHEKGED